MVAPRQPAPPELETQADVYAWTNVVARSRLSDSLKIIAFTVTTFANGDGTRVYPGITRLMVRTGRSRSTVTRGLSALVAVGLLEMVRRGNRRRGHADEYRLIFAPDLIDRIDLPSLEDEAAQVHEENERHRAESARRQSKRKAARSTVSIGTVDEGAEGPVDNPPGTGSETITSTVTQVTPRTRFYGQIDPLSTVTQVTPHLRIEHLPRKDTHASLLAGDQTTPSTTRPRQLPLLASVEDDEPPAYPMDDQPIPDEIPARIRDEVLPALAAQLNRINSTGAAS